ncbi:MAG: hypothetical protein PHF81_06690 [Flavobacterium sp.]|jgi:hypothetical protein|nr:hypothetical protein [Flavobacterium sp.]
MKKTILTITTIFISIISYSQCNCETIKRDDGTNVVQCNPLPIASDNTTQIGLAIASNGESNFVTITVKFKNKAQNISSDLTIRLNDNNLIKLSLVNNGLSYIGNSQVAQGIFILNDNQKIKISKSKIKTISLKFNDGFLRTYKGEMNTGILMSQVNCL